MKITITKTIQETHELELPAYRKTSCHYYKIVSETTSVMVCDLDKYESISISSADSALRLATIESNQEEFDAKLNEVVDILKKKIG
jgi:hypothetical protein